jgi:LysM repeat protein
MKGRPLTTIAQGTFCVLLGLAAMGVGRGPCRAGRPALGSASTSVSPPQASCRDDATRPGEADLLSTRILAARHDGAAARTHVTLRSNDGTVWEVEYRIVRGDTLYSIAARFDVPLSRVMIANGIRDPHHIRTGRSLRIPLEIGALDHAIMAQLPPSLRESPERLRLTPYFDHWANVYDIDPDLLKALGWVESQWRHDVVSQKGAIGVAQLMPDTVTFVRRLLGERLDPWTPEQNIQMAARFLRYLLDETDDVDRALAAYYQGLGALRAQGVYRDTRPYVQSVLAARRYFTAS